MVNKKISRIVLIFCLAALIFAYGCAEIRDARDNLLISMRSPGETMEKTPEETSETYFEECKNRRPNLAFLDAQVIPIRIYEGKEVNHRIRYAICGSRSAPSTGEIIRKVYFQGSAVFQDRSRHEFKQGTWVIDAFIKVPINAKPGIYEVDTIISYRNISRKIRNTFTVIKRDN